jgi:Protein of unknown function (DUF3467)
MSTPPAHPAGQALPELEIPADLAIEYVNMVRIAHSPSELVFDFAQLLPGTGAAKITSRIVMSPLGAKLFHRALTENLSRYEAAFGEIKLPGGPTLADNLFHSINPTDKPSS